MAGLGRAAVVRVLMRSFAVQGSWNYRTMLGAGIAFALVPALSLVYRGEPAALERAIGRHATFFNAHPYFATIALGALARLEHDGVPPGLEDRLKNVLVSPLGTLGDRLVWARWRPLCALLALLIFLLGAPWWAAVVAFFLLFNGVQVGLRVWGWRLGWREGQFVGRALLGSPLRRVPERLTIPLAGIAGAVLPLVAIDLSRSTGLDTLPVLGIALLSTAIGLWRPATTGRMAAAGLVILSLALVAVGMIGR